MITRREFGEKLLTCVAAGALANFALVAAPVSDKDMFVGVCRQGKDACATGGTNGDSCGNSGGKGQDKGGKSDHEDDGSGTNTESDDNKDKQNE